MPFSGRSFVIWFVQNFDVKKVLMMEEIAQGSHIGAFVSSLRLNKRNGGGGSYP